MKFLRTASTARLLVVVAGVIGVIASCAAIAIAAAGSGPVPKPKPLAQAVHDALAAPPVSGISARVSFVNHLIPSADIGEGGGDPLLQGGNGRLWISPGTHQLRLEIQSDSGDAEVLVNGRSFWASDPSGHTVYEGTLPAHRAGRHPNDAVPSLADIGRVLNRASRHLKLSGAQPTDVAGEPAYQLSVSPKVHPGLLGAVSLAWDAVHGTPLRIAVTARGSSDPVLELTATDISFGPVAASVFAISPPSGATVSHVTFPARDRAHRARTHRGRIITRGQGLDGIAVIETPVRSHAGQSADHSSQRGVNLPTVSVGGVSATELTTPLGTLIHFTRSGTAYTVLGSQPAAKVLAVARSL